MPAKISVIPLSATDKLMRLGQQMRAHRRALGVSATTAAMAAGMSRVTWHRIEKGEPSVTMGAYLSAMAALGLDFGLLLPANTAASAAQDERQGWIPARIRLADYPQLKQLAWQVHGTEELSPAQALSIYERNQRHLDILAMPAHERHLVDALRLALGAGTSDV